MRMDYTKQMTQLSNLHNLLPDCKYKKKLVELIYAFNKLSSVKLPLRRKYCYKCKTTINIVNNRSNCDCKRYIKNE